MMLPRHSELVEHKEPCIRWGLGSPRGRGNFGGYTSACPHLPTVSVLNFIRQGAAAMQPELLVYCSNLCIMGKFCCFVQFVVYVVRLYGSHRIIFCYVNCSLHNAENLCSVCTLWCCRQPGNGNLTKLTDLWWLVVPQILLSLESWIAE